MANTQAKQPVKYKLHVKKGDTVMVISGKDKGKTGTVKKVLTDKNKVVVDGLNIVKKAVKAQPQFGIRGGIVEKEAPLHASKVMLYSLKANKPTRIKMETIEVGGKTKRVRVCKHTNEHLDA